MKKKLFAATMSLLCATVMMVSSSFAWFTVSTQADVSGINVTMTATSNLEIAQAKDNTTLPAEVDASQNNDQTKYGNVVAYESTALTLNLPATVTDSKVQTLTFDTNGRGKALADGTGGTIGTNGTGYYTYTDTATSKTYNIAAVYGVWLRSNVDCKGNDKVTPAISYKTGVSALPANCKITAIATPYTGTAGGAGTAGTPASFDLTGTDAGLELTKNVPTLVQLVFYVDGTAVHASDVAQSIDFGVSSIRFTSTAVTGATGVTTTPSNTSG